MKKFFEKYKCELAVLMYGFISVLLFKSFRDNRANSLLAGLSFVLFAVVIWRFAVWFKRLFETKLGAVIAKGMKKLGEFLKNTVGVAINKFIDFMGFRLYGKSLGGRDRIEFISFEKTKKKRRKAFKQGKYDDCESAEQRVRYIYTEFLLGKHKQGYHVETTKTPNEIARDMRSDGDEKDIFDLYDDVRYGGLKQLDERIEKARNTSKMT